MLAVQVRSSMTTGRENAQAGLRWRRELSGCLGQPRKDPPAAPVPGSRRLPRLAGHQSRQDTEHKDAAPNRNLVLKTVKRGLPTVKSPEGPWGRDVRWGPGQRRASGRTKGIRAQRGLSR